MSVFAAGAATVGAGYAGTGLEIVMPGNIRDEIVTIEKAFQTLGKSIDAARSRLPADFVDGWAAFRAEWESFRSAHGRWIDNVWYASYRKALEYRARLDVWRTKFETLTGAKLNFPAPGAKAGPPDDGKGIPWRALAYGAIAIGGIYGLSKLLSSASEAKREIIVGPLLPSRAHA